jgi:hypothetical protein
MPSIPKPMSEIKVPLNVNSGASSDSAGGQFLLLNLGANLLNYLN